MKNATHPETTMKAKHRICKLEGNLLTIRVDDESQDYHLTRIPCDDGEGYEVEKVDSNGHVLATHHVNLYPASGHHSCDCPGGTYRGTCRHLLALVALEKAGRLSRPVCTTARAS